MRVGSGIAVVLVAGACNGTDAATPVTTDAPSTAPSSLVEEESAAGELPTTVVPVPEGVTPEGFSTVMIEVTAADGEVCEVCVWLADTADERSRGLMGVTDLGDAAGMLFTFNSAGEYSFYMLNTPTPLSIAWFDSQGLYVSSTDMEPCLEPPEGGCQTYPPGAPVRSALEVFEGGLPDLGVDEGSVLRIVPGSAADLCPAA